jgi:microcystin-dependent protein
MHSFIKLLNLSGIGTGDYQNWFICNGKNGTPDLKNKFLIGRDDDVNSDTAKIGMTGGQSRVTLSIDEMPHHTHLDQGHIHNVNLNTNYAGDHLHGYKDIFYAQAPYNPSIHDDWIYTPNRLGDGGNYDRDNVGYQIDRNSFNAGSHSHNVNGQSANSNSILTSTGGSKSHENRPPFYVIEYIIYMPK